MPDTTLYLIPYTLHLIPTRCLQMPPLCCFSYCFFKVSSLPGGHAPFVGGCRPAVLSVVFTVLCAWCLRHSAVESYHLIPNTLYLAPDTYEMPPDASSVLLFLLFFQGFFPSRWPCTICRRLPPSGAKRGFYSTLCMVPSPLCGRIATFDFFVRRLRRLGSVLQCFRSWGVPDTSYLVRCTSYLNTLCLIPPYT